MKSNNVDHNPRRQFLGTIAGGVAAFGLSYMISPI
ncbi:MAG TPA: twin-arginine translocation signal domain-containing protein [Chitinophagaceae bacterium]